MKKVFQGLVLGTAVLVLMTTTIVLAGTYRSPSKDTMCDATADSWCFNNFGIQAVSSGIAACIPDQVGFIGWDMNDVSETIGSAQLALTTYDVSGVPPGGEIVFELFVPSTQDWIEDNDQLSPGSSGTTLASTSIALINGSNPQEVVFGGSANPADADTLGAYFEGLKASGVATVGIRISDGCSLGTLVAFNDREDRGELPGGADATEPDLLLFTPTAVRLVSSSASGNGLTSSFAPIMLLVALLSLITVTATLYHKPLKLRD